MIKWFSSIWYVTKWRTQTTCHLATPHAKDNFERHWYFCLLCVGDRDMRTKAFLSCWHCFQLQCFSHSLVRRCSASNTRGALSCASFLSDNQATWNILYCQTHKDRSTSTLGQMSCLDNSNLPFHYQSLRFKKKSKRHFNNIMMTSNIYQNSLWSIYKNKD